MENEFIPYKQALELAKLNFNEKCFGYYGLENELYIEISCNLDSNLTKRNFIATPTFSQSFRWFREKYNLFGQVNIHTYFIYDISNDGFKMIKQYDKLTNTYEEAELECLIKLIEIVKNK